MFERTTLDQVWQHRAATSGDEPFLVLDNPATPGRNRTLTYAQIAAEVDVLAEVLEAVGVGAGDRVVVRLDNSVEMVVTVLAAVRVSAVVVPTITSYTGPELGFVAEHSGCAAMVTSPEYEELVLTVAQGCAVRPAVLVGSAVRRPGAVRPPQARREAVPAGDRTAMLMYTSGTTADPKGVMLSHRACLSAAYDNAGELRLRPDDRLYCVLPLFHVNAMFFQLMPALVTGATVVLGPAFSARAYWSVVARQGVTVGNLTNGPLRTLLAQESSPADRQHRMRLMTYALPLAREEIVDFEERFGASLSMGYGLTESLACGTRTPAYLDPRRDWQSIGMVSAGWDLRVVDEAGAQMAPGEIGELTLRGPGLMSGYYRDAAATAEAMREGWLHTGDLGYLDERGYVFFHDRQKDVIKVKGENVAAGEVERAVNSFDGVVECAAVGVPDSILGERIVMYVVCDGEVSEVEIRRLCEQQLAPFKVPSTFVVVDELPKTSIGKVRKGELRQLAAASTAEASRAGGTR